MFSPAARRRTWSFHATGSDPDADGTDAPGRPDSSASWRAAAGQCETVLDHVGEPHWEIGETGRNCRVALRMAVQSAPRHNSPSDINCWRHRAAFVVMIGRCEPFPWPSRLTTVFSPFRGAPGLTRPSRPCWPRSLRPSLRRVPDPHFARHTAPSRSPHLSCRRSDSLRCSV